MSNNTIEITPSLKALQGEIEIPSDKSISHRAAIFSSFCLGKTIIKNFSQGADCQSSLNIIQKLGIEIIKNNNNTVTISGKGFRGYSEPDDILDCGNSGTTIRMMLGMLAGQNFMSVLTGDCSLKTRPMGRVINPLNTMGAKIFARKNNTLAPITITPAQLQAIQYNSPIASAQVKSAILLAGLYADETTSVTEPARSRDHTERMLQYLGADISVNNLKVSIKPSENLEPKDMIIPGDISSAAFFMVAGSIVKDSVLKLTNVGINPTRTGIITVLKNMGADIKLENTREAAGEPVADIVIKHSKLHSTTIEGDIIPALIDEIPVLAVAAAYAEGTTIIKDAEDLRNKESDRLKAISTELKKLGADITETPDGLIITGKENLNGNATCDTYHDHRIAMALVIASLAAKKPVKINNPEWINISFPEFISIIEKIRA